MKLFIWFHWKYERKGSNFLPKLYLQSSKQNAWGIKIKFDSECLLENVKNRITTALNDGSLLNRDRLTALINDGINELKNFPCLSKETSNLLDIKIFYKNSKKNSCFFGIKTSNKESVTTTTKERLLAFSMVSNNDFHEEFSLK